MKNPIIKGHFAAPDIACFNGKYYFYFNGNKNIGVAVCDTPTEKFEDIGRPLVAESDYGGQTIDPDEFIDEDRNILPVYATI